MTEVAQHIQGTDTAVVAGLQELFVINLCASMTPMPEVPKHLKGFEKHKLYQVSKVEDGRRRYRLRLGFFRTETDAELLITSIRSMYPAAFVGCAGQDDLRYAGDQLAAAMPIPVKVISPISVTPVKSATPAPAPVKAPIKPTTAAAPIRSTPPATVSKLEVVEPPAITKPAQVVQDQPFHVGRGIKIPESSLELSTEELSQPLPSVAKNPATAMHPAPVTNKKSVMESRPAPKAPTPIATANKPVSPALSMGRQPASLPGNAATATKPAAAQPIVNASIQSPPKTDDYIPILDTTLTIRTLTKAEAEDPNRPKWFVVQLATSEQPINVSTMPKLDIFTAYSLYSVALMEGGNISHTLRLGFFKEQVSADAVMGYLKTFFTSPSVTQISSAEYDRFSEPKPTPKIEASVSQLDERRPAVKPVTTTTPAVSPVSTAPRRVPPKSPAPLARTDPHKQPSFLSRLIGKQLD